MLGSAFCYRGVDLSTDVPSGVVDVDTGAVFNSNSGTSTGSGGSGQQVTFGPNPSEVTGCRFNLRSLGAAVGVTRAAVYAADGSNLPTGTALVFSPYYAMDTPEGNVFIDRYFPLSGWTPAADTSYIFTLEFFDHFRDPLGSIGVWWGRDTTDPYSGGVSVISTKFSSSELDAQTSSYTSLASSDLLFTVYSVSGSTTAPDDDSIRFRDAMNRRRYGGLFR
jgi:hypothetical protein